MTSVHPPPKKPLKYLHNINMEFIIRDDFNINFLKDSTFKQQITLLFQNYNWFQSINFPTRIGTVSSSAIDNIFVDQVKLSHITYRL